MFLFPLPPAKGSSFYINCRGWWFPCSASGKSRRTADFPGEAAHLAPGRWVSVLNSDSSPQAGEFSPGIWISGTNTVLMEGKPSPDPEKELNQSQPIMGCPLFLLVALSGAGWPVSCMPTSAGRCLEEVVSFGGSWGHTELHRKERKATFLTLLRCVARRWLLELREASRRRGKVLLTPREDRLQVEKRFRSRRHRAAKPFQSCLHAPAGDRQTVSSPKSGALVSCPCTGSTSGYTGQGVSVLPGLAAMVGKKGSSSGGWTRLLAEALPKLLELKAVCCDGLGPQAQRHLSIKLRVHKENRRRGRDEEIGVWPGKNRNENTEMTKLRLTSCG